MTTPRDDLAAALWALHEAAQDAANDPDPDSLRAVDYRYQQVRKAKPAFYQERDRRLMAAAGMRPVTVPEDDR